ncbi:class I SAM-dependent methyltransferase [Paractinoplanes deccanensis]|uniref:class I SAM-dependent methyltransferase n=1 Tax=Paractinoplanes deccanensis TaxID=113561 RepID=UPI001940E980|nr:class I SAM-dependent methyltransferase [Actinoplanes deccanensis]
MFDEVAALYDRARPTYPPEVFTDLAALTGLGPGSRVLEVGCGTGKATRPLAELGCSVVAIEPGPRLSALARERLADLPDVVVETSTFEEWDDRGRRFDVLVAASSWHWVDPVAGPRRAAELAGHLALIDNTVVRRPGEPEMYAATADLHERFSPGNPAWGHPPLEDEVLAGPGPWYPLVQWLDGPAFADLLRTQSPYRRLDPAVREPLVDAVAARIREPFPRRYLCSLRVSRLTPPTPAGS